MKKISVIVLGLLAVVSTASAQTQTPTSPSVVFYAQPSVVVAFPGHFDTAAGGALALGVAVNRVHSIEVEVISFRSRDSWLRVTFTPLLATYKYRVALTDKLSLKAGASIGTTFEKTNYYWYRESQSAFTAGFVGGVSYALTDRLSFEANVDALRLNKTDFTTSGSIAIVALGLNCRF